MSALPWKEAGWTEHQAAAHLLDRFTFGATPGQVDAVVKMGLETWLERQLGRELAAPELDRHLGPLESLSLPLAEIVRLYPNPGLLLRLAEREGGVPESRNLARGDDEAGRRKARREVMRYAREQGYRPQRDLLADLLAQKLYRAVYAESQLREVLTDFWYNHFYVSLTDHAARAYVLAYERDAIRPRVLGSFRELAGASARHPAMLVYLDNARSTADEGQPTTLDRFRRERTEQRPGRRRGGPGPTSAMRLGAMRPGEPGRERPRGLNENYARELLELHTLGVDGGYTQEDVIEVARAFTGWSIVPPPGLLTGTTTGRLERITKAGGLGFVVEDQFLFRAAAHDAGAKTMLGTRLAAGRGIEDGEQVLDLLAAHPATAKHVAKKLAVRFVSDDPPPALVERLASTFRATGGDLRAMVRALAATPELWAPAARRAKIKSPFELAASALRATKARVSDPRSTLEWIARMGQPLYLYQAPTGYPDRADHWVSTGALLARMSFGLQLASGRVAGVTMDLAALSPREPASRREALTVYLGLLLPEREVSATIEDLAPVVEAPDLSRRVEGAAPAEGEGSAAYGALLADRDMQAESVSSDAPLGRLYRGRSGAPTNRAEPTPIEQTVGAIFGSPEFQRR